jgi:UDP-glucose 4-epimerase
MSRKVIVTGGAGFIGSHLVDKLCLHDFEIIVLDNFSTGRYSNLQYSSGKIKIIECDIAKCNDWIEEFKDCELVFHLASLADIVPSIRQPRLYFDSNVSGTLNVLEASRKYKVKKLIYSASSSCYGIPGTYPTSESAEINPQYPYALTKRIGEELVLHWSSIYNVPSISLRFFNVYGPRSRTSGSYGAVFGVFLAQKLAGLPFTIVGDGEQTRDFTYVSDVVDAIYASAESTISNEIYNVGSGATISINEIANLIGGSKINIPKRPGEPDCTFADISKIKRDLNWEPKISIQNGVKKVLEEIDCWKNAPIWDPESIRMETEDWFKYLGNR